MPRKRKFRTELLNNGTLTGANRVELGRIDMVEGIYVINEPALFKWLLSTSWANGMTPATKINMVFGPSGGWSADPVVTATLLSMERKKLIELTYDDSGTIVTARPLTTYAEAKKKLEPYTTRAEQIAGLEPLQED